MAQPADQSDTEDGQLKAKMEKEEEASTNCLFQLVLNHYKVTETKPKSQKELERDKWLIPCWKLIRFNRWFTMPAAVSLQFCLGSLYAFSVLNKPIEMHIFGEIRNLAPITFYIACGSMGMCTCVLGPWMERRGPKVACMLGTILFCSGHILSALALYLKQIWLVFIAYGLIGGFGVGLCYISPISVLQKWFPDRRGLASGVALSGFGVGSIALAKIQIILIDLVQPPLTFLILGIVYFFIMSIGSMILRTPPDFTPVPPSDDTIDMNKNYDSPVSPPESSSAPKKIELLDALVSKDFRLIYIGFISGVMFGLCAISRLSNMLTDIFHVTPAAASTIVAINGGFNLGGRLILSSISDFFGRKNSFMVMITIQLVALALFSTATTHAIYPLFVAIMLISTACYGGICTMIPAILTDLFGAENVATLQGIQVSGWSVAGVGGGLIFTAVFEAILATGYTTSDPYPYNFNSWWILAIVFIGWLSLIFVTPTSKDVNFWKNVKKCKCPCKADENNGV